ncbi:MAG: DNA/RNA nuclease SfsA [Lentisphaeria bacterium]|nr:DNA/RNA nuclease SfsA [Candidatus Neomarinimicrobiota bacterium]MCF7842198.1 DNA/RNA nuclease SfsA [Lentisphaeria bacterium]
MPRMRISGPLLEGEFIARPNRFLTKVRVKGKTVWAHLPDPGRLKELLIPGARVLVEPKNGAKRKTKFALVMVYQGDQLISINSNLPNRFTRFCLDNHLIPELADWTVIRPEFQVGHSRFDFLLGKGTQKMLLEVKSVTLVEDGVAKFPDAVTVRGRRHVEHLGEMHAQGYAVTVLFIVQRPDATMFTPQWERDPEFAQTLADAPAKGVQILVYSAEITPACMTLKSRLSIDLEKKPTRVAALT